MDAWNCPVHTLEEECIQMDGEKIMWDSVTYNVDDSGTWINLLYTVWLVRSYKLNMYDIETAIVMCSWLLAGNEWVHKVQSIVWAWRLVSTFGPYNGFDKKSKGMHFNKNSKVSDRHKWYACTYMILIKGALGAVVSFPIQIDDLHILFVCTAPFKLMILLTFALCGNRNL